MTDRVGVTAIVRFPAKHHETAQALFQKHLPMLRAYPGCQRFVVYHDIRERGVFTINEEWATEAQLEKHLNDTAITDIFSEIGTLGGEITNIFTKEVDAS